MTKREISQALKIAISEQDLSNHNDSILSGCGLKNFVPVCTTIEIVAKFLRWQCFMLNGSICPESLNECSTILKNKVRIL